MQWPVSELEYWSIFFSIDDNKDKPILKPEVVSLAETKRRFRSLMEKQ